MMPMCSISEAFRVLKGKEIRRHGEFRRTCLLPEGDRLEADGSFKRLDL
jgi:hypothetical protein